MPAKINMFITNNNHIMPQIRSIQEPISAPKASVAPTSLTTPIIARIHNTRPGCGSCGRR